MRNLFRLIRHIIVSQSSPDAFVVLPWRYSQNSIALEMSAEFHVLSMPVLARSRPAI
jgi:hypothetical protein